MLECVFCYSSSKDNYIFTECNHLSCLECLSTHWDGKYSLKCCGQNTYLPEQTIKALNGSRDQRSQVNYIKEEVQERRDGNGKENREESYCQQYQLEESVLVRSREVKAQTMFLQVQEKKKEDNLYQMERILNLEVTRVKETYQSYRKQIERKEQMILKDLYNTYSDHLNTVQGSFTQNEVSLLQEKLLKVASEEPRTPHVTHQPHFDESKQDRILDKLDFNQQKMRQKLQRHYQLLK